jgi:hypothetical protein
MASGQRQRAKGGRLHDLFGKCLHLKRFTLLAFHTGANVVSEDNDARLLPYFISQDSLATTPYRSAWRQSVRAQPARPPRPAAALPCRPAAAGGERGKYRPGGRCPGCRIPLAPLCGKTTFPETGFCPLERRRRMKTPKKKSANNSRLRPGSTGQCEAQV